MQTVSWRVDMSSEDLLNHFKLEAQITPTETVHSTYRPNRARRGREKIEQRWLRMEKIGDGAFGQVWREVKYRADGGQDVRAVKAIEKSRMTRLGVDHKKELLALAKFSKQEYQDEEVLVSLLGWFENDQSVFLAMEYFAHGDLSRHIESVSTEDEIRQIITNLLDGLSIIHAEGFTHRDLKPQNVFVVDKPPQSERWWVKIGDFGISKRVKNEETALRTQAGTPCFQAPEIHGFIESEDETSEYSNIVDIWSLGCVMYNVSARRVPFSKIHEINSYCRGKLTLPTDLLNPRLSAVGIIFLEGLLVPEPTKRMTLKHAIAHPWIISTLLADQENSTSDMPHEISTLEQESSIPPKAHVTATVSTPEPAVEPLFRHFMQGAHDWESCYTLTSQNDSVLAVAFSPDGTILALGSADGKVQLWDPGKKKISHTLRDHDGFAQSVVFSPDCTLLASCSMDGTIRLWDMATKEARYTLESCNAYYILDVAFSPDGAILASCAQNGEIELWDTAAGKIQQILSGHRDWVYTVVFSPDGTLLASGSGDKAIRLWDMTTKETRYILEGHTDSIMAVAISPDGTLLASGSLDETIRLWDVTTGEDRYTLSGHDAGVEAVAFSPDGTLLASGSQDSTVRLWGMATKENLFILSGHVNWIRDVAFSPDCKLLASASRDKTVRLWGVKKSPAVERRMSLP